MIKRKTETYTMERRHPECRFWVDGRPQSAQKAGSNTSYRKRISTAAKEAMGNRAPCTSGSLIVEVWFCYPESKRPEVDNVLKPILDAMEGVVYINDRQVRQVKCTAFPDSGPWKVRTKGEALGRLRNTDHREFLVLVFDETHLGVLDG